MRVRSKHIRRLRVDGRGLGIAGTPAGDAYFYEPSCAISRDTVACVTSKPSSCRSANSSAWVSTGRLSMSRKIASCRVVS